LRAMRHSLAALTALAGAPVVAGVLAFRPGWRVGIRERLGALPRPEPGAIWIHAASVGEVRAAARLVDRLRADGHPVFTSTVTVTGRAVMHRTRPEVPCRLAPLDHPWCVASALARVRPSALILIETELWPSWIAGAARRGVPVVLVSGRVSDRSYPRYRRLAPILRPTLGRLAAIGARSEVDAERFRAMGADPAIVSVTGDLKLELEKQPPRVAPELAHILEGPSIFVAGSTHPGEESAVLAALASAERAGESVGLVLAPRHPERAAEVERLVRDAGRPLRRRAELGSHPLAPGEVLVLDTVGELTPVYACADVAFVGGSLVPRGGHNVLEPVYAGCPVLFGRHTANVRHAVEIVERSAAGRRVEDARGLGRALVELLRDPGAARGSGASGLRALSEHQGSADRTAALIESILAASSAPIAEP
jgi:3-deoxy-D-manno-octulosonic-acid transferase